MDTVMTSTQTQVERRSVTESASRQFLFEKLMDVAPDCLYLTDEHGTFSYVNSRFLELTGYSRDELLVMNYLDLVTESKREEVKRFYLRQVMHGPETTYFEYPIITRSGREKWIGQNAKILFDPHLLGFYATARDITEKRFSEFELERTRKLYKEMFDNSISAMFQSSPSGKLLNGNDALLKLLGYDSMAELFELDLATALYVDPAQRTQLNEVLQAKGYCQGYELRLMRKDSTIIFVLEHSRAIRNSSGDIIMYEGILEDITTQKEQQERLQQYVTVMKVAQESLAKTNSEKDKIVSILSHDLRSPFSSILGFCDILLTEGESLDPLERTEFVTYIKQSAEQQLALVNDLLDWSRITTGRAKQKNETLDLAEITTSSAATHLGIAKQKEITLSASVPAGVRVSGDHQQLYQLFNNLISNALKFTPNGGQVSIELDDRSMGKVVVTVRDNGAGIPPDDMSKLFKAEENYTRPGLAGEKGTGFGLPLCKEIVERHGGTIRAESTIGVGTTFYINLPLADTNESKNNIVLVVDDEKGVRVMHTRFVKKILPDAIVVEAENGKEALALIEKSQPRLILADHSMPQMNGVDMINAIRQNQGTKHIPVLVVTGEYSGATLEALRAAGASEVLGKPATVSELEPIIKRLWMK